MTKNFEEGPCTDILIDEQRGDLIGQLFLSVSIQDFDHMIRVTFDETLLLVMRLGDLYHVSRAYHAQNVTQQQQGVINLDLIQLLMGYQYLIICGGHQLKIMGQFKGYSAEMITLSNEERRRYVNVASEHVTYGYHVMTIQDETPIKTHYPVMDLFAIGQEENQIYLNLDGCCSQQLLSENSGVVANVLTHNVSQDKVYYMTTQLHEQTELKFDNWTGWILPTTMNFVVKNPCRLILRYVTLFKLESAHSYYEMGLTEESRPLKEVLTSEIEKAYHEHLPMPFVEEAMLTKYMEKKKHIDFTGLLSSEEIARGYSGDFDYYENRYFSPTPMGSQDPIKLPGNYEVPKEVLEMIWRTIHDPRIYQVAWYGCQTCHLLKNSCSCSSSYSFEVDHVRYHFTPLLLEECTTLKIPLSPKFIEAMQKFLATK